MELYLSACSKPAANAATNTSGPMLTETEPCKQSSHKMQFQGVGAAQLLDLPLGVKLPLIPGSNTLFYTTNLSEKLFQPSYGFNLSDPYGRLLETRYKSLHDPHLSSYYKRKDILKQLKKGGYITSNNKIVCTLKEFNKYRQYLTSLKLDFERNYIREQKMLEKKVTKLQEHNQIPNRDADQLRKWLLQQGTYSVQDQECLIRHRYLDMISRELEKLERSAEKRHLIRMNEEEKRQREHTRKKLILRKKIEEEWKTKEMLLLTRIGEEVKREARVEEQRRKNREESDRKKQALLEKKMAYHLWKMHRNSIGKEDEKTPSEYREYRGQEETYFESDEMRRQGYTTPSVRLSRTRSIKKSVTSMYSQSEMNDDDGATFRYDGDLNKKMSGLENRDFENSVQENVSTVLRSRATTSSYPVFQEAAICSCYSQTYFARERAESNKDENSFTNDINISSSSLAEASPSNENIFDISIDQQLKRPSKRELPTTLCEKPTKRKPSYSFETDPISKEDYMSEVLSNTFTLSGSELSRYLLRN
ncbi:fibrous sheath-interacting protein 2 isoform X7 [Macrotis lagotis]|uniref:fibrous sheath-interacting protein 2 isoform X7 n=1 Tax=Macrotis lagotis TaxID=92651 RepID=UPI003D69CB54